MTHVIGAVGGAVLDYLKREKHFKKSHEKEKPMKSRKTEKDIPVPNAFSLDLKKQIEEAAYYKWIHRELQPDNAETDWLEAEEEVLDSLKETRG